uniref:NADH-ubiquinone oxidoreductase chain 5 n=1 Tax=Solemya elarraichensis TaxID=1345011 RepID=A0A1W5WVD5_9BIVA|nr:NADH dehydrogenase subunit 5 [Solemya elarraichensis]ARH10750.1 NADH dehydrogenase subunit 5 [Solemya elarraichensis]
MKFYPIKASSMCSMILFIYSVLVFPASVYFIIMNKWTLLEWEFFSSSTSSMTLPLLLDPLSLSFSNIVCLISACVLMFSTKYMDEEIYLSRFIWLVMLFVLSMNMLVFIPNMLSLLIGWDGLGIVSFALVIYYENHKSLAAGMLTALANRIGDVMLIIAIALSINQGFWSSLHFIHHPFSYVIALGITVAAMTKSAQIPFSSWLPAAMAAPTPVSALVHSSTLVTAGVFLLIRFYPFLSTFHSFFLFSMLFSSLTLLMAGLGANFEYDLKKIIALSTLSQLGVMMLSISLKMPMLALFHLYTHAMFKALLFLCAGAIIYNNTHSQDIRTMGNLWKQMPLTITCMNTANLALCGAPFMAGFYSKDLILETMLSTNSSMLMIFIIFFATGLTATYSIRLSIMVLWKQNNHLPFSSYNDEQWLMTSPMVILTTGAIFSGMLLQILVPNFNETLTLPLPTKVLTMVVTLMGAWLGVTAWNIKINSPIKHSIHNYFLSSMWFLSSVSTQKIINMPLLITKNLTKTIDQGWFELYGGQGVMMLSSSISKTNQHYQNNLMPAFIMMMISSMLFILTMLMYLK